MSKTFATDVTIGTTGSCNILIGPSACTDAGGTHTSISMGYAVVSINDAVTFGSGSLDSRIAFGATSITAPSDQRLKEDIQDDTAGLSFINDLRPVTYRWRKEKDIPEDDPRNPATIADNVGDNVGDVAGMGADLFGSYVATVLAAMVLGNYVIKDMGGSITDAFGGIGPILLPMAIAGAGIIISIIGTLLVRITWSGVNGPRVAIL